jgi:hypothetical protein
MATDASWTVQSNCTETVQSTCDYGTGKWKQPQQQPNLTAAVSGIVVMSSSTTTAEVREDEAEFQQILVC